MVSVRLCSMRRLLFVITLGLFLTVAAEVQASAQYLAGETQKSLLPEGGMVRPTIPFDVRGTWIVTSSLGPRGWSGPSTLNTQRHRSVGCHSTDNVATLIGSVIEYREDSMRWNDITVPVTRYIDAGITAGRFDERTKNNSSDPAETFQSLGLGIYASTSEVTIEHPNIDPTSGMVSLPGDHYLSEGDKKFIFKACGIWFEAVKGDPNDFDPMTMDKASGHTKPPSNQPDPRQMRAIEDMYRNAPLPGLPNLDRPVYLKSGAYACTSAGALLNPHRDIVVNMGVCAFSISDRRVSILLPSPRSTDYIQDHYWGIVSIAMPSGQMSVVNTSILWVNIGDLRN